MFYLDSETETIKESERFQAFIGRSQKLCRAWEVTLLFMPKSPSNNKSKTDAFHNFDQRVKLGMKTIFHASVYEDYITGTNYSIIDPSAKVNKFCF